MKISRITPKIFVRARDSLSFRFNKIDKMLGFSLLQLQTQSENNYKFLWDASFSVYSQNGEDGILSYLVRKLEILRPSIIEFGAGDFSECNSRFLVEFFNASSFLVDGNSSLVSNVQKSRLMGKATLAAKQEWITRENAKQIFHEGAEMLGGIDIVSLDLDGMDYWVLSTLPLENVSILVIEFNAVLSTRLAVTVPYDSNFNRSRGHFSNLYYGASLKAFCDFLRPKNFHLVGTTLQGSNAFFVRSEKLHIFKELQIDLLVFQDSRSRESRDLSGNLTYLTGEARADVIRNCELINLETGGTLPVSEAQ